MHGDCDLLMYNFFSRKIRCASSYFQNLTFYVENKVEPNRSHIRVFLHSSNMSGFIRDLKGSEYFLCEAPGGFHAVEGLRLDGCYQIWPLSPALVTNISYSRTLKALLFLHKHIFTKRKSEK